MKILRKHLEDVAKGSRMAVGFTATLVLFAFAAAFAAAAWGALPTASSWAQLSSAAWNDVVSQVNVLASALSVSSGDVSLASWKTLSAWKFLPSDVSTVWAACSPAGAISKDSVWAPLSCQSSVWTKSGGGTSFGAVQSLSMNTVYQAATDGIVVSMIRWTSLYGYADSNASPSTLRAMNGTASVTSTLEVSTTMPVKKGEYWKMTFFNWGTYNAGMEKVYWMPIQ